MGCFTGNTQDVKPVLPSVSSLFTVDPLEPVSTLVKYALTTLHGVMGRQRALLALSSSVSEEAAGRSGGGEPVGPPGSAVHGRRRFVHGGGRRALSNSAAFLTAVDNDNTVL